MEGKNYYQAFCDGYPNIDYDRGSHPAKSSGEFVSHTNPPKVGIEMDYIQWVNKGKEVVEKHKEELSKFQYPAIDKFFFLYNEGDVSSASALYIIPPITTALKLHGLRELRIEIECISDNVRYKIKGYVKALVLI